VTNEAFSEQSQSTASRSCLGGALQRLGDGDQDRRSRRRDALARLRVHRDGSITLGKAYLVSRLKVLMQGGRMHLARTDEMDAMQKELMDYEIRINEHANDTYGAFKTGAHDDLVTALGLAVQQKPVTPRVTFIDLEEPAERGGWRRLP